MTRPTLDVQLANMRPWLARRAENFLPREEVADAVQDAMVAVWQASARVRPGNDPWPLLTVAGRAQLGRYAQTFYAKRVVDRLDDQREADLPPSELVPSTGDAEAAFSPRLAAALAALPERQREILLETVGEGRTNLAAASLLGVSEARVRQSVARSLEILRAELSDQVSGAV
ncbi:sigma-70 family RNA polymerase sigma factor [Micromonospora sediminicola]|uniref:sigma-70 family RNA polymerase sigma factor n=1 Tax=Micromonospora sediminicola TaxID=946078 RepID=UPI00379E02A4